VCASMTVKIVRSRFIAMKSSSSDRPVITSGMTSGAKTMPENSNRPRNRVIRTRTTAASVPSNVAAVADTSATRSVTHAASRSAWLRSISPYHCVENPAQTVTRRDALNE
jgi:hypothetical protein